MLREYNRAKKGNCLDEIGVTLSHNAVPRISLILTPHARASTTSSGFSLVTKLN